MCRYPLGIQSFRKIREDGFVYVDKTGYIRSLLEGSGNFYFLSRPRRFGKSLFLSTLENFFLGKRELFAGLAIESYPDWEAYPIIRINLAEGTYSSPDGLRRRLNELLGFIADDHGLSLPGEDPRERFTLLIRLLVKKHGRKVVVLVDEYEKPLLDAMQTPYFEAYSRELADFYSVLKANEENIHFLFLTGVTRFGHLNIFSGLNNLTDISLSDEFSAICGITQRELESLFGEGIEKMAAKSGLSSTGILTLLKEYYDGYHFSGELVDIYNPYTVIHALWESKLTSQWFISGSSTHLLRILQGARFDLASLEGKKASSRQLLGTDASMLDPVTLLYQSGYLTIKGYDFLSDLYTLGIPNREVRQALFEDIIPYYLGTRYREARSEAFVFIDDLEGGRADKAMQWLKGYFSSIPYDVKLNYEADFQQVVYAFFALVGLLGHTVLEKQIGHGRIDMVLGLKEYIYVFEFKLGTDSQKALEQIDSKEYALQWEARGRKVIKVGIAFSPETRGIASYSLSSN